MTTTTTTTTSAPITSDDYAIRVKGVESIGRRSTSLANDSDTMAAAIIANVGESYDWTARGAKPGAVHLFTCGAVKGDAVPVQRKDDGSITNYGTGVNTLVKAITRALDAPDDNTAPAMRVSLKGTGSAVVPADHPAYALLLALLGADAADDSEATDGE